MDCKQDGGVDVYFYHHHGNRMSFRGESLLNMSNSLSSVTEKRLADYFVICGLDLTSGLEPDQLAGNLLWS